MAEPLFRPDVRGVQRLVLSTALFVDPTEIVIRVPGFSADRARFYGDLFEKAPEAEKGKVAVAFLRDAPASDWTLAGWLFGAIGVWKVFARRGSVEDKNLKLVAREMGQLNWARPEMRALLLKHRNESRRRPQDRESLATALTWYWAALPDCKDAKKQAHWYRSLGKRTEFDHTVIRGIAALEGAPTVADDFYPLVRHLFGPDELDEFARRLYFASDDRENGGGGWPPKKLAAWIASKGSGVARRRIENLTVASRKNTRSD